MYKKKLKVCIILFAMVCCFFSGCKGTEQSFDDKEKQTSKYRESAADLAEYYLIYDTQWNGNNELFILTDSDERGLLTDHQAILWTSTDQGATWTDSISIPQELEDYIMVDGIISADGKLVVALQKSIGYDTEQEAEEAEAEPIQYYLIDRDGNVHELLIDINLEIVIQMTFVSDGQFVIADDTTSYLCDLESESVIQTYEYSQDVGALFDIVRLPDDKFALCGMDATKFYECANGAECEVADSLKSFLEEGGSNSDNSLKTLLEDDILYSVNATEIKSYSFESEQIRTVMEFTEKMLKGQDAALLYFTSLSKDKEDNFYVSFLSGHKKGVSLNKYSKEQGNTTEKTFSIYVLHSNEMINQAVLLYEAVHPEKIVEIKVGVDKNAGGTEEDAIRVLNTQILAGEGPDIILMDGISVDTYIEKGMLMDLADVILNDSCFENIVNRYAEEEKIYAVPTSFSFYAMQGDKALLDHGTNVNELSDYLVSTIQKGELDGYQITNIDGVNKFSDIIQYLYILQSNQFVQDKKINEEKLGNWFLACKQLHDLTQDGSIDLSNLNPASIFCGSVDILYGEDTWSVGEIQSLIDLATLIYEKNQNEDIVWGLSPTENSLYTAQGVVAINAKSEHGDEAKEFVRFLLSEEAQELVQKGFPVNRKMYASVVAAENYEDDGDGILTEIVPPDPYDSRFIMRLTDEQQQYCIQLAEQLNESAMDDEIIKKSIMENLQKYLEGSLTLEEAQKDTVQKINLYLSE